MSAPAATLPDLAAPFAWRRAGDVVWLEASLGPVFGVDRQLISEGTYFIVEHSGQVVGCGGWSRRAADEYARSL